MSKLYVGNLSWDTTEETLRQVFSQDGRKVTKVSIITDRDTGRPRGFAFVEMESKEDADGAIEALNETELDGRNIRVNEAQERAPRPGGGRGGFGGGGGGGGRGYGGGGGGRGYGGGGRGQSDTEDSRGGRGGRGGGRGGRGGDDFGDRW